MFNKIKNIILSLFLISIICGSFSFAYADCGSDTNSTSSTYDFQSANATCPPTVNEISKVAVAFVEAMLAIAIVVFFIVLIINGFNFVTSVGTPEKIENARKGLVFSVIGFGLVFGSFLIISIISSVTGVNGGLVVSPNGNLQFNIISTFTPTPLSK